ncbi:hypothetical protein HMPREF0307_01209 [Corynebacterium sp. DNF00584]|nr:hypothetical protein HMPREF0307_01209 [Corynebacterium sp. DNF00584]
MGLECRGLCGGIGGGRLGTADRDEQGAVVRAWRVELDVDEEIDEAHFFSSPE